MDTRYFSCGCLSGYWLYLCPVAEQLKKKMEYANLHGTKEEYEEAWKEYDNHFKENSVHRTQNRSG